MNAVEKFEQDHMEALMGERSLPTFAPGDTIKVNVKVVEGTRERIQAFEGVCIARKNRGINSSFTVRKISYGEGVERVFPLYSPRIDSIEMVRRGDVRRAKLYYLRDRRGKSARIAEKTTGLSGKLTAADRAEAQVLKQANQEAAAAKAKAKAEAKAAEAAAASSQASEE